MHVTTACLEEPNILAESIEVFDSHHTRIANSSVIESMLLGYIDLHVKKTVENNCLDL